MVAVKYNTTQNNWFYVVLANDRAITYGSMKNYKSEADCIADLPKDEKLVSLEVIEKESNRRIEENKKAREAYVHSGRKINLNLPYKGY